MNRTSIISFPAAVRVGILALGVWLAFQGISGKAQGPDFSGFWAGTVNGMDAPLSFSLNLGETSDGIWAGTFTYSTPDTGIVSGPAERIVVFDRTLSLRVFNAPDTFSFEAALSDDGGTMDGYLQAGVSRLALTLRRESTPMGATSSPRDNDDAAAGRDEATGVFATDSVRGLGDRRISIEDVPGSLGERGLIVPRIHPAIRYDTDQERNRITDLNRRIRAGEIALDFDEIRGYLPALLEALDVPVESQTLVFSKTSLQRDFIGPANPRAIFFADDVAVAWIRNAPLLEVAAHDPTQGVIFYTLGQRAMDPPQFERNNFCVSCHDSRNALGVPGLLARSVFPSRDGDAEFQLGQYFSDHRSPFTERWGGWYVTGREIPAGHLGNAVVTDFEVPESMVTPETRGARSLEGRFGTDDYLSPYSDVVALMVFDHQVHMTNLLTRIGWEIRFALHQEREFGSAAAELTDQLLSQSAEELVDYLLFVDEATLPGPVTGTSGFKEAFEARGPQDSTGRSLRQFDLDRRLMRHPCSYMIYSPAFEALPGEAREAIYARMWHILSGEAPDARYARLSLNDRRAIVEILGETKPDLPGYFDVGQIR